MVSWRVLILFCDCSRVSSASSAEGVSFHPYQLSPLVSGAYTPLKLRHRSGTIRLRHRFGTIRLWYDIAVFVAVLSFHSARYRSDYGPRRPWAYRSASYLGAISTSAPRPHRHRSPCVALVRYDSGMTSPVSQLCFRSIVHDIAAAMSRRPVCYHTFAKSLRFTRHHTQLPFLRCAARLFIIRLTLKAQSLTELIN